MIKICWKSNCCVVVMHSETWKRFRCKFQRNVVGIIRFGLIWKKYISKSTFLLVHLSSIYGTKVYSSYCITMYLHSLYGTITVLYKVHTVTQPISGSSTCSYNRRERRKLWSDTKLQARQPNQEWKSTKKKTFKYMSYIVCQKPKLLRLTKINNHYYRIDTCCTITQILYIKRKNNK